MTVPDHWLDRNGQEWWICDRRHCRHPVTMVIIRNGVGTYACDLHYNRLKDEREVEGPVEVVPRSQYKS